MITKITIKNFKAIRSANIKLSDLSVFVGNNGSGKSSVIEALETLQNILFNGLSYAFNKRWFGFEYIINSSSKSSSAYKRFEKDIKIEITGKLKREKYIYSISFNSIKSGDLYLITHEKLIMGKELIFELKDLDDNGNGDLFIQNNLEPVRYFANRMVLSDHNLLNTNKLSFASEFAEYVSSWQFLTLDPELMFFPTFRDYSSTKIKLKRTGENLADFFSRLQDNTEQSNNILEKMRFILPSLDTIGREEIAVQKQLFLFLTENNQNSRLPSWLFSTGTLRILAIFSILNSTDVPPVIFIEEIENGLDPRTLNLLVSEMQSLISDCQFITTTHSPYFLDLVDLKHVIMAEREDGSSIYYRPDDNESLNGWKKKFSAGSLYTMDKLKRQ